MAELTFFSDIFKQDYSISDVCLMTAVILFFLVQFYFYVIYYGRVARNRKPITAHAAVEPISVVIIVREDLEWIDQTLPLLLTQEHESFEIIAVDMGMSPDVTDALQTVSRIYPHLITTRFKYDPKFPISNKMAYNVGIKAARYPNIVLTTTIAKPNSSQWLHLMSENFASSDVVLGYCRADVTAGSFFRRLVRSSMLMSGVRFAAAAMSGRPYRGAIHNIGFKRDLYFAHKGFNYLNMNIGEDDLFIHKIANADNCSVIFNANATVSSSYNSIWEWRADKRFHDFAISLYPMGIKITTLLELVSRVMFWISVAATIILTPTLFGIVAILLLLLRLVFVIVVMKKVSRKVGEKRFIATYPVLDIIAPFDSLWQSIQRRVSPMHNIWR